MNFFRRFIFYFFGVALGVAISYSFFSDREYTFNYFPNDRVLSHLLNEELYFSQQALLQFQHLDIDTLDIVEMLTHGKVDFSQSNKKNKQYQVVLDITNYTHNSTPLHADFMLKKDTSLLLNIW